MTWGKNWAIFASLALLLAVGIELIWLHHSRSIGWKAPVAQDYHSTDPDDLVFLKKQRPSSLADVKRLDGKTVWVSAGGQLDYYPYGRTTRTMRRPWARCSAPSR